jgi:hypothetical protein
MSDIERVSPEEAREKVQSDSALLVCAYHDDEKYRNMRLDGSIAHSQFNSGISGIAKDREIIFY